MTIKVKPTLRTLLLTAALGLTALSCGSRREQELETFAARWRVLYNSHDVAGFAALYSPRGAFTAPGMVYFATSQEQIRQTMNALWRIKPGLRITAVNGLVASGDRIAFVYTMSRGVPGSPKQQTVYGATFITVKEGLITDQLTVNGA